MLSEHATPENISIDWLNYFASSAQDVGEDELMSLWASILDGEATNPGKYSKRTLDYLKSFDVKDCQLIKKLVRYLVKFKDKEDKGTVLIIPSNNFDSFKGKYDFNVSELMHLCSIGIISNVQAISIIFMANDNSSEFIYNNKKLLLSNPTEEDRYLDGVYVLSEV